MNNTDKIELYRKRDMGQVMATAAAIIRRHPRHLFRTVGLMTLPLFLMTSTLYFLMTSRLQEQAFGRMNLANFETSMLFYLLAGYLSFCALSWGCVYYLQLYEEKGPENFDLNDIWNKVFSHGWKLLAANLLYFLLAGLSAAIFSLLSITVILIPVVFVGMLFLFAFVILLPVIFLMEREGTFSSINRAFQLLRKNWLKAVGIMLCCWVMVFGCILLPMVVVQLVGMSTEGFGMPGSAFGDNLWVSLVIQNLILVLGFFSHFFLLLCFGTLYYSLSEARDRHSLRRRVAELSNPEQTA